MDKQIRKEVERRQRKRWSQREEQQSMTALKTGAKRILN